jgi:hypothetical protein
MPADIFMGAPYIFGSKYEKITALTIGQFSAAISCSGCSVFVEKGDL